MIPPVADRFVAGETTAEAVARVRWLNDRNVAAIVNLLGEHYEDRASVTADAAEYRQLVDDLADGSFDAAISVKPTQLGLDLGASVFREILEGVVAHAAERDVFVWIDMEGHETTDATLEAYEALAPAHPDGVGVCLQANLRRTRADLERLAALPGRVRLVKGAYDEPASIAYTDAEAVNRAYADLLAYAFEHLEGRVAVGSHDPAMIERALALAGTFDADFEVQMLMGVREDAQFDLATECRVVQYVPYGSRWRSYFFRRVLERKENLLFALRAVLGR